MQKPNPVIKNYIYNPEPLFLGKKTTTEAVKRRINIDLKTNNNKSSLILFI